jgi:hypothetical protein
MEPQALPARLEGSECTDDPKDLLAARQVALPAFSRPPVPAI